MSRVLVTGRAASSHRAGWASVASLALAVMFTGEAASDAWPEEPPRASGLLARYVLMRVQPPKGVTVVVPAIYDDDSAGFKLRVDADTLFFFADSTYRESGRTALLPVSGNTTVRPQTTGEPSPRYSTTASSGVLTLPGFMGRQVNATYFGQSLVVYTNAGSVIYEGPTFYFEAR